VNAALAVGLFMLVAGFGGSVNGLRLYGGFVKPQVFNKKIDDVMRTLVLPGVRGDAYIGSCSGLLVFMFSERALPIAQHLAVVPTWGDLLGALMAGLMGSVFIDKAIDIYQRFVLDKLFPAKEEPRTLFFMKAPARALRPTSRIAMQYLDETP
jgi:hypothetical protein